MWLEERLIYFPTRGGHVAGPGEDLALRTDDGVKIYARYIAQPRASQTLLYLHGNAGNLAGRSDLLAELAALPANVLAIDYRGYGTSEGTPSEAGLYLDALAAYRWLIARTQARDVIVLGESLGGGPACQLASTQPVGGLILQSTFTSIADMGARSFPWLPVRAMLRTRFDNLSRVRSIAAPKLIVHSRADDVVPFEMGQRLFAAAASPKQSLWLSHAHHSDAYIVEAEPLNAGLRAFLQGTAEAPR
jgi:fermentation-respiration switch protein FrsA (DUF1100 family)